jgi:hypothetical protein
MPRFPCLQAGFVLFLMWESACARRAAVVPLPAPPAASQPVPPAPAPAATTPAAPAAVTTTHAAQDATAAPYQVNKPPQTPAAKKPRPTTPAAPAAAAEPAPPPPAAPPAAPTPPPKLGDILSPEEQRQYNAAIDQSLSHAQASLNSLGGRQLNKDQQAEVDQIRNFMQQAQASRGKDPSGAKSLSERAEVLARDLAASFK